MPADCNKSLEELLIEAKQAFEKEFGQQANVSVCAPGRVNLIGEHIDYNDGFVLPMALPLITVIVGRKIPGHDSYIATTNPDVGLTRKVLIEMPSKQTLVSVARPGEPKWANYVKGVVYNYIGDKPAFEALVVSNVPTGGGLSSSAALEVATYTFLDALNGEKALPTPLTDKALVCQKAEHDYAGVPCGIMDQFISMMGKEKNALLIDCRTLTSTQIPVDDPSIVILIVDSNVKHELSGSEYSSRRRQCEEAAKLLKKTSLRDATEEDIDYLKSINADEIILKRAKHVVGEIRRTKEAAEALSVKDYVKFGKLMWESHVSLQTNYEVSCSEVNQLVGLALGVEGVLGARMTGGGFGGCIVAMVYSQFIDDVKKAIIEYYRGTPTFYVCKPSRGARILL